MNVTLVYLENGAGPERKCIFSSLDAAVRDACTKRQRHSVVRIETPTKIHSQAEVEALCRSGRYVPHGTDLPKK
jgi:hypothetical protein